MDEAKIKQIAGEVFDEKLRATQYNFNSIPYHVHNGTDSPKIPFSSLSASFRANGSITMATDGTTYTIGVNFQGTRVDFNGTAVHKTAGVVDKRVLVNGVAFLGPSYLLSTSTSTSITLGGAIQPFVQGSSSLSIDAAATPNYAVWTSQNAIVEAVQPGTTTVVARAIITSFNNKGVKVLVALSSGWEITGTFAVS